MMCKPLSRWSGRLASWVRQQAPRASSPESSPPEPAPEAGLGARDTHSGASPDAAAAAPAAIALTREYVLGALREVIDPELGYNIVDLGLIYGIEVENANGAVRISMTMTTPGCPAQDYIMSGVYERGRTLPGVQTVDIDLTWDPPWSPGKMSPAAKEHFGIEPSEARDPSAPALR